MASSKNSFDQSNTKDTTNNSISSQGHRGSGSDLNSNSDRLSNPENMEDKAVEDSFPASDPPSTSSPVTGFGRETDRGSSGRHPPALPKDFKDNPQAQFEYGRRSEEKTHHFDTSTRRLEMGNPDIGEVDLGTIEADKPAQPDDNDHYDSPLTNSASLDDEAGEHGSDL